MILINTLERKEYKKEVINRIAYNALMSYNRYNGFYLKRRLHVAEEEQSATPLIIDVLQWSLPDEKILIQHGCQITQREDTRQVTFPQGTTRSIAYSASYRVGYKLTLPDGFRVLQVYLVDFDSNILYPSAKNTL
jgi:hypothetical protein